MSAIVTNVTRRTLTPVELQNMCTARRNDGDGMKTSSLPKSSGWLWALEQDRSKADTK